MTHETSGSPEAYFLDIPNTRRLYIVYNLRCNYACAHCLVSSSPSRHERMKLDQAIHIIDAASHAGYQAIYLTGGEVFLYYRDLLQLIRAVSARGLACIVETNGAWAVDVRRTNEKLDELVSCGLSCIAVSIDLYHLAHGSIDPVLRIVRRSTQIGFPCRVSVIASPDRAADERLLSHLRAEGIRFLYETLMSVGRGGSVTGRGGILQRGKCDSIGVTVMPDGEAAVCPGAFIGEAPLRETPLYVGQLTRDNAVELLAAARRNLIANVIDAGGHARLEALLPNALRREVIPEAACDGLCDYCHKFISDPVRVTAITKRLEQRLPSKRPRSLPE